MASRTSSSVVTAHGCGASGGSSPGATPNARSGPVEYPSSGAPVRQLEELDDLDVATAASSASIAAGDVALERRRAASGAAPLKAKTGGDLLSQALAGQ